MKKLACTDTYENNEKSSHEKKNSKIGETRLWGDIADGERSCGNKSN